MSQKLPLPSDEQPVEHALRTEVVAYTTTIEHLQQELETIKQLQRECDLRHRAALLEQVDAIERRQSIEPRTALLRRALRRGIITEDDLKRI